jgi:adenylate kinase family enzyme
MPSFLAVWAWGSSMLEKMTGEEHIIVDGTPRMMGEALLFNEALQFYGRSPIIFVYLNVPAEEVTKRLTLRARADDSAEGINNRLKAFEEEVVPVIEYFKTAPGVTFVEVDGHQTIEAVQAEIKSKLSVHLND